MRVLQTKMLTPRQLQLLSYGRKLGTMFVFVGNYGTREAILLNSHRQPNTLECWCPYCLGHTDIMTPSHINITPLNVGQTKQD